MSTKSVMGTAATGRRNRSWPEALKREIVAASFAPGSSVSMVARQYDVNANQVFNWRKRYRDEPRAPAVLSAPQLIPVVVAAERRPYMTHTRHSPRYRVAGIKATTAWVYSALIPTATSGKLWPTSVSSLPEDTSLGEHIDWCANNIALALHCSLLQT